MSCSPGFVASVADGRFVASVADGRWHSLFFWLSILLLVHEIPYGWLREGPSIPSRRKTSRCSRDKDLAPLGEGGSAGPAYPRGRPGGSTSSGTSTACCASPLSGSYFLERHCSCDDWCTTPPQAATTRRQPASLFAAASVVDACRDIINDFYFGLYEEEIDGQMVLTKQDPEKNVTIQMEWAKYAQCVKYVRRDAWTAKEYLEATPPSYSVALGRQYPVLLTPAKPDMSRYFLLPALDFVVGGFVKHSGVYDANEENILRKLVRPGDCIIEIGANIGSYTVVLADEVGLSGKVYAYEPFRKIFHILSANMALQGYGNVVTRQVGFSNHVSVQNVNAPDLNDYINLGAARVFHQQKEEIAHVHFDGFEEIEVETIDSLHSRDLIKCGDREWIMKIDTEGMEKEVVEGGIGVIQKYWPLIYVESQPYFSDGDRKFVDFMAETVGYSCSPIKQLEMHEILLCMPVPKNDYWNARLQQDFSEGGSEEGGSAAGPAAGAQDRGTSSGKEEL